MFLKFLYVLSFIFLFSIKTHADEIINPLHRPQEILGFDKTSKKFQGVYWNEIPSGHNITEQCREFISNTLEQDSNWDYLFFERPLSIVNNKLQNKKTYIFAYGRFNKDQNNKTIKPLIFYNGGPGGSSWGFYHTVKSILDLSPKENLENIEDIIFNLRGNEEFFEKISGAKKGSISLRPYPDYKDMSEISYITIDQRGTGCNEKIDTNHVEDLAVSFSSIGTVQDSERLREILGSKQWSVVMGQSYGGYVVRRYIEQYPEALKTVVSHGFAHTKDGFLRLHKRLISNLKMVEQYFKLYPKDKNKLAFIRKSIPGGYIKHKDMKIHPQFFIDKTFYIFIGFTASWSRMNQWIHYLYKTIKNAHLKGDLLTSQIFKHLRYKSFFVYDYLLNNDIKNQFSDAPHTDWSLSSAVNMVDQRFIFNQNSKSFKDYASFFKEVILNYDDYPIFEERGLRAYTYISDRKSENKEQNRIAKKLKSNYLNMKKVKNNLKQNKNIRFFIYSSEYDSFDPPSIYDEEVDFLEGLITYKNLEYSGHEGYKTETSLWKDILDSLK